MSEIETKVERKKERDVKSWKNFKGNLSSF